MDKLSSSSKRATVPTASGEEDRFRFMSALRHRHFRIYYAGVLTTAFGVEIQVIARGWLMYNKTESVFWLGLVTASLGLSAFATAPIGGLLADRISKRTLMVVGQLAIAIDMVLVGISISAGIITPWLLVAGTGLLGISMGLTTAATLSAVSQLVEPEALLNAVSLSSSTRNVTRIAAPLVAGYVIRAFGADTAYYSVAAFQLFAALIMLGLPKLPPPGRVAESVRGSIWSDAGEGFRSVKSNTTLGLLVAVAVLGTGFGVPVNFFLPIFAEDVLHVGPEGLGILTSTVGVGSVLGLTVLALLGNYQHKGGLLLIVIIGLGVSVASFGLSDIYWLSLALLIPVGFTQTAQVVLSQTLLLANSSDSVRGRIMSIFQMTRTSMSFTIVTMGALALVVGAPVIIQLSGGVLLIGGVILTVVTPVLRRLR